MTTGIGHIYALAVQGWTFWSITWPPMQGQSAVGWALTQWRNYPDTSTLTALS